MNTTLESKKHFLFPAFIGAAITYGVLNFVTDDDDAQLQQIASLESKVHELEVLLAQKDDELINTRIFGFNSVAPANTVNKSAAVTAAEANQKTVGAEQELAEAGPTIDNERIFKNLVTSSDRDPRSFSVKVNDLLAEKASEDNIAIISKGVFDLAENRDTLPDYELDAIYQSQTNPDLRRVVAQVASARGDNRLMEKQITDAQAGLRSESPAVRQKTLTELAKTRHASAANVIAPLLKDSNNSVKLDALLALRATGNQSHIHMVEALVNDPDPSVSWLANDVISNLQNLSDKARTKLASGDIMAELPVLPIPSS
jgi:hypothetical protein